MAVVSPTVLVIEDEPAASSALAAWLTEEGLRVRTAETGHEALAALGPEIDVIVLDYGLPDLDGFEVLRRLQARAPLVPTVMLTGRGSVAHAVEAMKRGAFHYVTKPVDLTELTDVVRNAAAVARSRRRQIDDAPAPSADPTAGIVGDCPAVRRVRALIHRLGRTGDTTVLITGESGTGKDLAARALHATSPRAGHPFVNITCTALPTALLESELFGHERGAFTDAKARHRGLLEQGEGGTIFLDEIGDMDPALQAKLLRVLEERRYRRVGGSEDLLADVRIVAATNVDLSAAVRAGRLRQDLYYRLAVLVLPLPPLRERTRDVELLTQHFLAHFARRADRQPMQLTPAAQAVLGGHPWPGNIRELRNVIERAVILAENDVIDVADLQLGEIDPWASPSGFQLPPEGVDMAQVERELVQQALDRTGGNVTHAARLLGMKRDQVRYRIQKFSRVDGPSDDGPDDEPERALQ